MSAHSHGPLENITHVQGGAPVLDIGGTIGALVVRLDQGAAGTELHLRPDGATSTVHTGVWTRHLGAGHVTAALFDHLTAGRYQVLDGDGDEVLAVTIIGGELTDVDLTSDASASAEAAVVSRSG